MDLELVDIYTGRLALENGTCVWRESGTDDSIELSSSYVTINGREFHLRDTFDEHFIGIDCAPVGSVSTSTGGGAAPGAACVGSAASCSSVGDCYAQDGCHYAVHDAYSTTDDRCEGSATACDHYSAQPECEHQSGCSWRS